MEKKVENAINQFSVILSKIDMLENDKALELLKSKAKKYAYILHNRDINENGEVKTPHYHMYIYTETRIRKSTLLRTIVSECNLDNADGIQVQHCTNSKGLLRYLIHKDDIEKTQYEISEVSTKGINYKIYVEEECEEYNGDKELSFQDLITICEECNFSLYAIGFKIGLKNLNKYRGLIESLNREYMFIGGLCKDMNSTAPFLLNQNGKPLNAIEESTKQIKQQKMMLAIEEARKNEGE